jgi:hypothetical protein
MSVPCSPFDHPHRDARRLAPPLLTLALVPLLVTGAVRAQTAPSADDRAEARRLGQQAMQAFADEDYPTALALLQRSYELNPIAGTLFNVGMTQRALFEFPAAIDTFRKLLAETPDLPAEQRAQVEQFLGEMEAALVWLTVAVSEPGATVLVDGLEVGVSPLADAVRLRAGSHVIEARKEGFVEARETVQTAAGEQRQVSLALQPRVVAPTRLRVTAGAPEAAVFVDGAPAGPAPVELDATPGAHEVRVEAPGHAATTIVATVVEGRTNEISAVLVPLGDIGGDDDDSIVDSWWLWTIVGVVVAGGAITAGVLLAPGDERPGADYSVWMR